MRHLIGYAQNKTPLYVDLIRSDAAKHISQKPYMLGLASEAIKQLTLRGDSLEIEHDMGRAVGYDLVVETTGTDLVFYARLLQDKIYTRFIKTGKPSPTQHITMLMSRNAEDASYDLQDIWIGPLRPSRPNTVDTDEASSTFWENHAYIFDNPPLQSNTITKTCPY